MGFLGHSYWVSPRGWVPGAIYCSGKGTHREVVPLGHCPDNDTNSLPSQVYSLAHAWELTNFSMWFRPDTRCLKSNLTLPLPSSGPWYVLHWTALLELGVRYWRNVSCIIWSFCPVVQCGLKVPESDRQICMFWLAGTEGFLLYENYIRFFYKNYFLLFVLPAVRDPDRSLSIEKSVIKTFFMNYKLERRMQEEIRRHTVMTFLLSVLPDSCQSDLIWVTNGQHCFVLTRLQLGTVLHLVAFPDMNKCPTSMTPCPCDGVSIQSMQHYLILWFSCRFEETLLKTNFSHTKYQGF